MSSNSIRGRPIPCHQGLHFGSHLDGSSGAWVGQCPSNKDQDFSNILVPPEEMVIFCQINGYVRLHPKEWQLDSCKLWDCYSQGDKHEIWAGQGWRYTRVWKLVRKNIMKHFKQIIRRKSGNNPGYREKLYLWKVMLTWESLLYLKIQWSKSCKKYVFRPYIHNHLGYFDSSWDESAESC